MSPPGCQKMSAKPCNRNAEESFPVLSLKSREQKPPNPLLIQDKDVLQPRLYRSHVSRTGEMIPNFRMASDGEMDVDGQVLASGYLVRSIFMRGGAAGGMAVVVPKLTRGERGGGRSLDFVALHSMLAPHTLLRREPSGPFRTKGCRVPSVSCHRRRCTTSSLAYSSTAMPLDGQCARVHLHFCNTTVTKYWDINYCTDCLSFPPGGGRSGWGG